MVRMTKWQLLQVGVSEWDEDDPQAQEKNLVELQFKKDMRTAFEALLMIQFWIKQFWASLKLAEIALKFLTPFTTT